MINCNLSQGKIPLYPETPILSELLRIQQLTENEAYFSQHRPLPGCFDSNSQVPLHFGRIMSLTSHDFLITCQNFLMLGISKSKLHNAHFASENT